ncbi:MAG: hypothetical protein PWP32_1661 [Methanothermobacter sp.]|jgi:SAM-dependent methyltransferase|uniref:Methyltransferase family protein n=2 Tax=Methanothermobacter TaxID=145260 RepID=A0A371NES0_9EURY|nr:MULTISPECIES: class I SAM-dependent methyltransferase [Methanothermobacter]MDN5374896.1 hypothetical protein [Methanothermobacter sp.]REE28974.1 methyltransferase family protein [Methanothermobacter defluvii]WBF08438.1 class I SAM-dependent methyltransferase [Methanothermobacter thermautotrophicus]HIH64450.1 class I SAM-dependent methyltransferase [Methanothermobacter thermautotrophicus]HIH71701.1 class I SAM-dependent methyltransferase [Methanothermobacter thermautotrophicus]
MPIGDSYKYLYDKKVIEKLISIMGTPDLHSHIRIKPLINFFKKNFKGDVKILEIGCGNGINAFELLKYNEKLFYHGFDLNPDAISQARLLANLIGCEDRLKFYCDDAQRVNFDSLNIKFDLVLLMDILEHLQDPEKFLKNMDHLIKDDTLIAVSVPTPRYKKVFGENFHESIGHLRDGYTLRQLSKLFKGIDCELNTYSYNTGHFSDMGCYLYYRFFPSNRYLNLFKILLLYPFRFLDIYNSESISCSIFAVFSRRG